MYPFLIFILILSSVTYAAEPMINKSDKVFIDKSDPQLVKILPEFKEYVQKVMEDWKVPGMAIAVVKGDKIIYAQAFGVKEAGGGDPVDLHTIFQIGSMTKSFTATLIGQLVDDKKLTWTDKIISLKPDFKLYDPQVTEDFAVEDLMAQRSGLPPYSGEGRLILGFNMDELIYGLRFVHPITKFRSYFDYQNVFFLLAGELIEKYTDSPYQEALKSRIFVPLEMSESSASLQDLLDSKNVSSGHHLDSNHNIVAIPPNDPVNKFVYEMAPAGGINSNVIDLSNYLIMQINDGKYEDKEIISNENLLFTHQKKIQIDPSSKLISFPGYKEFYAEGWFVADYVPYTVIQHGGETNGYKSIASLIPEAKLGIVILSNRNESKLPDSLSNKFIDLYFNNPGRDWSSLFFSAIKKEDDKNPKVIHQPTEITPSLALNNYIGTYTNPMYGTVTITQNDNQLELSLKAYNGHFEFDTKLHHWDENKFSMEPGFSVSPTTLVNFGIKSGAVQELTLKYLDSDHTGTFTKEDTDKKPAI